MPVICGRNLVRGLSDDEIQIIGIEFTVQTDYHGNQELAMFSPSGLILPRLYGHGDMYRPQITFHSSDGDFALTSSYAPW